MEMKMSDNNFLPFAAFCAGLAVLFGWLGYELNDHVIIFAAAYLLSLAAFAVGASIFLDWKYWKAVSTLTPVPTPITRDSVRTCDPLWVAMTPCPKCGAGEKEYHRALCYSWRCNQLRNHEGPCDDEVLRNG